MNYVVLHGLHRQDLPMSDLRPTFDFLQDTFGSEEFAFARIGRHAYLRGNTGVASAKMSCRIIEGQPPDDFMPDGPAADTHDRLLSEVQMALHDFEVNIAREMAGKRRVNSLWIWGGGVAPERMAKPIPALFANDPLFKGYWYSCAGLAKPWSDDLSACLNLADNGFVAVAPERSEAQQSQVLEHSLTQLQRMLAQKKLRSLTVLFRDGLTANISSLDRFRFWRRESSLLLPS